MFKAKKIAPQIACRRIDKFTGRKICREYGNFFIFLPRRCQHPVDNYGPRVHQYNVIDIQFFIEINQTFAQDHSIIFQNFHGIAAAVKRAAVNFAVRTGKRIFQARKLLMVKVFEKTLEVKHLFERFAAAEISDALQELIGFHFQSLINAAVADRQLLPARRFFVDHT